MTNGELGLGGANGLAVDAGADAQAVGPTGTESQPYSVAEIAAHVSGAIAKWPATWIEGELIKFRIGPSGHAYPTLKDLNQPANIDLAIFKSVLMASGLDFVDGDKVLVSGKFDLWAASGKFTFKVSSIRKVGLGDLLAKLEALRTKLREEGLTDPARKKPLPFLPNRIGLITGANSDAEKDVKENVLRRWPDAKFEIINTLVQGEGCPPQVIAAIKELDANPAVDVIIIARGGGAFLDLIGFSDEGVVRAAAAANTPIISAIGHENDHPLLDDVADWRASTPTDAAKKVVPDVIEERRQIADGLAKMKLLIGNFVTSQVEFIKQLRSRPIVANPYAFIDLRVEDLDRALGDLRDGFSDQLLAAHNDIKTKSHVLASLSPQSTLNRGYSVVRDEAGKVIADAGKVKAGQKLKIRVAKGDLDATAN